MKYILTIIMLFVATNLFADAKITDLATDTTPDSDSLFILVDEPAGVATNVNTSMANIATTVINDIDTSAELASEVGDETGTGLVVFGTSPTITTPTLQGAVTISEGALTDSTIVSADIKDDTIDSADYAAGSIDAEHLAADIIDETKIADNGIDSEHYNDDSIDADHIDTINCGTNCTWDAANDEVDVDDAFIVNDADDDMAGWLTVDGITSSENIEGATITEGGIAVHNNDEMDASSEMIAIMDDETGTNLMVFNSSPTLIAPTLGTIASGEGNALTNLDGENIANDTIDNDSIDWADMTDLGTDGIVDCTDCLNATEIEDIYLLDDGDVGTGSYDFGGADDFEIPQDKTVDADGEITVDGTTGQFRWHDGTAQRVTPIFYERGFVLEDPVEADDNVPFWHPHDNITITDVYCEVDGATSAEVIISDGTNVLETIACDEDGQADDGSIANGTFSANERMEFDIGTVTDTPDWLAVTITYTIDAD